ncbi:thiamine pyrophosphate-binding protein [Micromonospora endophytica]|nr:thiamine pyrophosphate-binding protein [Micromonospora endophytica]
MEALVRALAAWRVPRVFGQPGEQVAPLVEALRAAGGEPEYVPTGHGESAAFMATAHARLTGGLGVCLAPAGPAGYELLGGLDTARRDGLPVLAVLVADGPPGGPVAGLDPTDPAERLFAGMCRHVRYATDPGRVDEAVRYATTTPCGPVCLVLPAPGAPHRRPAADPPHRRSAADPPHRRSAADPPGEADPGGSESRDPLSVLDAFSARLPARATVTVDGDPLLAGYARQLRSRPGLVIGDTPSGAAVPYAVAAKLADPDRPVFALTSDAGMRPHGLAELVTVARRWPAWPDPRLVIVVFGTGRPGTEDVPYAGWARLLGLHGIRVDQARLIGVACHEALTTPRPTLLTLTPTPLPTLPTPTASILRFPSRQSGGNGTNRRLKVHDRRGGGRMSACGLMPWGGWMPCLSRIGAGSRAAWRANGERQIGYARRARS